MPNIPPIAVVQRAFGNTRDFEGLRNEPGTRFAVGKPIEGLRTITEERYLQLLRVRLVRPLIEEAMPEPMAQQPTPDAQAPEPQRARPTKRAAGARQTQDPEPPAPKRLDNPAKPSEESAQTGSPIGALTSASSSQADPASNSSKPISKPRGRRRASNGSPSTTPSK